MQAGMATQVPVASPVSPVASLPAGTVVMSAPPTGSLPVQLVQLPAQQQQQQLVQVPAQPVVLTPAQPVVQVPAQPIVQAPAQPIVQVGCMSTIMHAVNCIEALHSVHEFVLYQAMHVSCMHSCVY